MPERFILVNMTLRRLFLMDGSDVVADFPVLVGKNAGPKQRMGDDRTPEGTYHVAQMLPDEAAVGHGYYKGLHISYPHPKDAVPAFEEGMIDQDLLAEVEHAYATGHITPQASPLGGEVAIHGGLAPDEPFVRGTRGCVVMRNADMDQVYAFANPFMKICIEP